MDGNLGAGGEGKLVTQRARHAIESPGKRKPPPGTSLAAPGAPQPITRQSARRRPAAASPRSYRYRLAASETRCHCCSTRKPRARRGSRWCQHVAAAVTASMLHSSRQRLRARSLQQHPSPPVQQPLKPRLDELAAAAGSPEMQDRLRQELLESAKHGLRDVDDVQSLFDYASVDQDGCQLILDASSASRDPDSFIFDLSVTGHSSIEFSQLPRPFPPSGPSNGYTFMAWIKVLAFDVSSHTTIFGAFDESQTCFLLLYLERERNQLVLQTSLSTSKPAIRFKKVTFEINRWYHIALIHRRPSSRDATSSPVTLLVDGEVVEQVRCNYPQSAARNAPIQAFFGTPQAMAPRLGSAVSNSKWSLATAHLFSDTLSPDLLFIYQNLGPSYQGNFQDALGSFHTFQASANLNLRVERLHPDEQDARSVIIRQVRSDARKVNPESNILLSVFPGGFLHQALGSEALAAALNRAAFDSLRQRSMYGANGLVINAALPFVSLALQKPSGIGFLVGAPVVIKHLRVGGAAWRESGCLVRIVNMVQGARSAQHLMHALEAAFALVNESWRNNEVMERDNGFGILSWAVSRKVSDLQRKSSAQLLADTEVMDTLLLSLLKIILAFIGFDHSNPGLSKMVNALAYRHLIVDSLIWSSADAATQELFYGHIAAFFVGNSFEKFNTSRLSRMRLIKKLIEIGKGRGVHESALPKMLQAFKCLLKASPTSDNYRSVAMFVTFGLQDKHSRPRTRSSTLNALDISGVRMSPAPSISDTASLVRGPQLAIALLDALVHCLDEGHDGPITKFATSVTNKWLLDLLANDNDQVTVAAMRILTRMFAVLGPPYVHRFDTKTQGFVILRARLGHKWRLPRIWLACFLILFGADDRSWSYEGLNPKALVEHLLRTRRTQVTCPAIFPVITAMFEMAFSSLTTADNPTELSASTSPHTNNIAGDAVQEARDLLGAAVQSVENLFNYTPDFREFAQKSQHRLIMRDTVYTTELSLTRELMSALYSGSPASSSGQDEDQPFANSSPIELVASSTISSDKRPPLPAERQRTLSFVMVGSASGLIGRTASLRLPLNLSSRTSMPDLCDTEEKRHLRSILCAIYADQILRSKDFTGLGLFLKVPPSSLEHRAAIASNLVLHVIQGLSAQLDADPDLYLEPRVLTHLSRFIFQSCEALYEGWLLGVEASLLAFAGSIMHFLDRPTVRQVKSVRLCSPQLGTIRTEALEIGMFNLMLDNFDQSQGSADDIIVCLMAMQDLLLPREGEDPTLFRALCSLLYRQLWSSNNSTRAHAASLWRSFLAQRPKEVTKSLIGTISPTDKMRDVGLQFCMSLQDEDDLDTWLTEHKAKLDRFFTHGPDQDLDQIIKDRNRRSMETAEARRKKRDERVEKWHLQEIQDQHTITEHEGSSRIMTANIYESELLKSHRSRQDHQENLDFFESLWHVQEKRMQLLQDLRNSAHLKWQLDESEGRDRMRMRLIPSDESLEPSYQPKRRNTVKTSSVTAIPSRGKVQLPQIVADVPKVADLRPETPITNKHETTSRQTSDTVADDSYEFIPHQTQDPSQDIEEDKNRKVMRTLHRGETVEDACNVSVIRALEALETLLIVGSSSLYLMENLFQRRDGEVVNASEAPDEERDPYTKTVSGQKVEIIEQRPKSGSTTRSWPWKNIVSISQRRFLFRDVAIEIFFRDGRSYLLTAATQASRDSLYTKLESKVQERTEPVQQPAAESLWKTALSHTTKPGALSLGSKVASVFNSPSHKTATRAWAKGEMSNFQYLMLVNTLAGRTFNDLTQYPVFPWVIADYTSDELDLSNPRTFRDLSKPMGCQSPQREVAFRERFKSFAEMDDSTPAFHYGTHYSSAMIVTSYLIRLQPFVKSYLLLQGGTFDHAERLFQSIEKAWKSASQESNSDVRELTPEFFYLPEFLVNINNYNFGAKEGSGEVINNVKLPPWAKSDPAIFIAKQREALESPYVSQNLHGWIDLIFGFKQRGEAALEATNVFHYLTYEGAKNIDDIKDEHDRIATIGIIHNFGQTPKQVFTRPHDRREDLTRKGTTLVNHMSSLRRTVSPLSESDEQVKVIKWSLKDQKIVQCSPFMLNLPGDPEKYLQWGYIDNSIRFYSSSEHNKLLSIFEQPHEDQISVVAFADKNTLITASDDSTIALWTVTSLPLLVDIQPKATLFGHRSRITHIAVSLAFGTIVSASADGTVFTWDLNRLQVVRKVATLENISSLDISDTNGHILLCTVQAAHLYTLNGALLLSQPVSSSKDGHITCCTFHSDKSNAWLDAEILFTGHEHGNVKIWSVVIDRVKTSVGKYWTLELVRTLDHDVRVSDKGIEPGSAVTCVQPINDKVYVGSEDGKVFEWVPVR
ncbi:hypothetical protein FH972_026541 [Carpinus fangiana]|uniref:Beach-domain-containing protein n=1 Tax=Carpinus fangiana TaxID=176857 RepID=A0A5N6L4N0_9ROSI|nr:hypothetical protein FH972_026541 [Carpinus fangiana]